jgi:hypothetical protein
VLLSYAKNSSRLSLEVAHRQPRLTFSRHQVSLSYAKNSSRLSFSQAKSSNCQPAALLLRHNPNKPRVLFALVNEPTIRCPLCVVVVTHQHYPTSYPTYFIYVANEFSAYSPARSSPTLLPFSSRVPTPYTSPRPFTCRCQGPSPYSAKDLHLLLPRTFACSSP